jgi:hypothetical protein
VQDHGAFNKVREASTDLRRVYFSLVKGTDAGVYLNEDGHARPISVSHIAGEPATPRPGQLLGSSRDGRFAFFYSEGAPLTDDAPGTKGDVYRYDAVTGALEYLGAAAATDNRGASGLGVSDDGETFYFQANAPNGEYIAVWRKGFVEELAQYGAVQGGTFTSPDGRYLAYLTLDFSKEGYLGRLSLFDSDTGQTVCVSCSADGSDPHAASVSNSESELSNQFPEVVTNDGQVLFTSLARLVPGDVNGTNDVYSYQDGKVTLISPGDGPYAATYADRSADGRDIYFTTAEKLVGRDSDGSTDVYDARLGGGFPGQNPTGAIACSGEACAPPIATSPQPGSSGSESVGGRTQTAKKRPVRCVKSRKGAKHRKKCTGRGRKAKHGRAKRPNDKRRNNR